MTIGYNQSNEFIPKNIKEMNEQIKKDLEEDREDYPLGG